MNSSLIDFEPIARMALIKNQMLNGVSARIKRIAIKKPPVSIFRLTYVFGHTQK